MKVLSLTNTQTISTRIEQSACLACTSQACRCRVDRVLETGVLVGSVLNYEHRIDFLLARLSVIKMFVVPFLDLRFHMLTHRYGIKLRVFAFHFELRTERQGVS